MYSGVRLKSYANSDGLNYDNVEKIHNYPTSYDVKNSIPIQYTLLNPFYVVANRTTSWKQVIYQKILSEYELERLQNPKNQHDKLIFDSLDSETKDKISLILKEAMNQETGLLIPYNACVELQDDFNFRYARFVETEKLSSAVFLHLM